MSALLQVGLSNCVMALALAVVAASVGRWCRRPAVTHGLWLLVLLKLITPPLVFVPVSWPEPDAPAAPVVALAPVPLPIPEIPERVEEPIRPDVAPVEDGPDAWDNPGPADLPVPPAPEPPLVPAQLPPLPAVLAGDGAPWPTIALALWLGGSACWFVLALGRIRRFQRLLRHATTAPMELQVEAETLAARLGLARCPRVLLVHGVVSPMLWAVGQAPRLLLPASLLERVSAVQRATLLAHELAHLRRRDHVVRLLELVVLGLYWWFPLVWWARRELREAEEECCDAWVVWALPDSPRAYATALVETLDWLSEASPALPPVASGIGQLPLLRRRLTMIMRGTTPRALTGLGLLALLGLGLLLLPLVPSWAQPPGPGRPGVQPGGVRDVDLEKARAEVKRMAEDLKHLQESLEKQHRVMEIQAKRFADAMEWLKRAEFERAHQAEAKKEFGF
ncbi:MAG TPA: M56 family metallopeptidase, partial [Gemmataceae bacterium]|nr:M56 family metallopeptidase [Gemmataceae bacterium]